MKRTFVALAVGALIGSMLTGLAALSSAAASGQTPQPATVVAESVAAQPEVAVSAQTVAESEDEELERREGADPVLGGGTWGTRSDKVSGARGDAVTSDSHAYVETIESRLLTEQQAEEFLELFENSRGVRRLITKYGGDPDGSRTLYYVKAIDANEDRAGNNTSWVTATLRADFASPEGKRGIEMRVYRKKISHSVLDNTPYISSTQISYLDADGRLSRDGGYHPPGETGVSSDGLATIRFKN